MTSISSSAALVTPFLVMGVGCDDVFVFINSYSLAFPQQEHPRERCITTFKVRSTCRPYATNRMQDCGVSVLLTTATNLFAFGVGCQSPYVSIRNFCLFSLNALAFSLFFELTIFLAALCLEAKREVARNSCCCCGLDGLLESEELEAIKRARVKRGELLPETLEHVKVSTFEIVHTQVCRNWEDRKGYQPIVDINQLTKSEPWWKQLWLHFSERGNILAFEDETASGPSYNSGLLPNKHGRIDSFTDTKLDRMTSHMDRLPTRMERLPSHLSPTKCLTQSDQALSPSCSHMKRSNFSEMTPLRMPVMTEEPIGNVGRKWRLFFGNYYCHYLLKPATKVSSLFCLLGSLLLFSLPSPLRIPPQICLFSIDHCFGCFFGDFRHVCLRHCTRRLWFRIETSIAGYSVLEGLRQNVRNFL